MTDYQRARSPEQKAERMEAIMDATEGLFRELPYHEITMGLIAKELGWARSNLYKYAATQEEIFLALHSRANRAFIDDLLKTIDEAPLSDAEFAKCWATVTARHAEFLRYEEILAEIIESNTSFERLVDFKRSFKEMSVPLMTLLERQTDCAPEETSNLYFRLIFQAPGLYNRYHCTDRTAQALRAADMPPVTGMFEDAYADFVTMCLEYAHR